MQASNEQETQPWQAPQLMLINTNSTLTGMGNQTPESLVECADGPSA